MKITKYYTFLINYNLLKKFYLMLNHEKKEGIYEFQMG